MTLIVPVNLIRLKDVIRCCKENKLTCSEGTEVMDINTTIACLRDLFEHLADERHASGINVPLRYVNFLSSIKCDIGSTLVCNFSRCSIDLSLNWLLNVYDLSRQGHIKAISFQVGLVILSRGAVEDKFNCKYCSVH